MPDNLSQPIPPTPTPMLPASPPPVASPPIPPIVSAATGGSKKIKIGLAILILFLLSVSIPMAVWLTRQRQEIRKYAEGEPCENSEECPQICHFNVCRDCSDIGDAPTCATHNKCAWINDSCQLNTNPPPSGDCTPTITTTGGGLCGSGSSASVSVRACLPDTCSGLTSELRLSFSTVSAQCGGTTYAYNCSTTCGNAGSTQYITFPAESQKGTCRDLSVPCSVPNGCGACQVDIRGNGANVGERVNDSSGCTTPTPTGTPQPTATPPGYSISCLTCQVYDTNWNQIAPSSIQLNQTVYFATQGSTNHPQGITKARFRINGGTWQETTNKHGGLFYIQFTVPSPGSYLVESMVYNPVMGWY